MEAIQAALPAANDGWIMFTYKIARFEIQFQSNTYSV